MSDAKSTNDVRLIALDVVQRQAELCGARRDNLGDKLVALADTVSANTTSIGALTQTVATLAATVTPLPESIKENEDRIDTNRSNITKLQGRPAVWAAIGAALPTLLGVLLWFFTK